jgi:hypothetical protein
MAYQLLEMAHARWRRLDGAHPAAARPSGQRRARGAEHLAPSRLYSACSTVRSKGTEVPLQIDTKSKFPFAPGRRRLRSAVWTTSAYSSSMTTRPAGLMV